MAALKEHVKLFIVRQLAWYNTPTEVAAAVREEFGIELDRGRIGEYNPTTERGKQISAKLKAYFDEQRELFLNDYSSIPISQKSYRMHILHKQLVVADQRKNVPLVLQILEQAAKEDADFYSGKKTESGNGTNVLMTLIQQVQGTALPVIQNPDKDVLEGELVETKREEEKPAKTKKLVLERD